MRLAPRAFRPLNGRVQFVRPQRFSVAADKLGARTPVGSKLSSAEWRQVPVALRERAFFSAKVEDARFLTKSQRFLDDHLRGTVETLPNGERAIKAGGRAQFVKEMQEYAVANGMGPLDPKDRGGLKDITSETRLGLIFDVNIKAAQGYATWKAGMDPDLLDAFPAQRFIRVQDVIVPRPWHEDELDTVRLKTDLAFWIGLNRDFEVPWGPWGFGSGCDVEDVDRDEAESLGLLEPGGIVEPVDADFNDGLQASLRGLDPEMLEKLRQDFGDQIEIDGQAIRWRGVPQEAPPSAPAKPATPSAEPPSEPARKAPVQSPLATLRERRADRKPRLGRA